MNLQDTFYLTATLFFIFFFVVLVYLVVLAINVKTKIDKISTRAKITSENLLLAGNTFKAGILRLFLNMLGNKGGDNNE